MNMELLVHVEKLHTSCYGAQLCLHKDFYHNSSLARTWGSNMLNMGMHSMQELLFWLGGLRWDTLSV